MADTWSDTLDEIKRRLEDLAEAIGEALGPQPERVPVPVTGGRARRPARDPRKR